MKKMSAGLAFAALLVTIGTNTTYAQTETGEPIEITAANEVPPLDDFTQRNVVAEKKVLKYAPIREADVLWETRLWRVVDTREKMNLPFTAPESPLFTILQEAIVNGKLTAYSTENDRFTVPMSQQEATAIFSKPDTVATMDMDTGEEIVRVVLNTINWENVKRFRIKEAWFFDKNMGTLRHRILGIAPMIDEFNDQGDFLYERPLFWVHYPSSREVLASHKAVASTNVAATITWEDIFERRQFASYIYKESNVHDRRLTEYLAGVDMLMESQKIQDALFNQEHDLWSW